jgi:hypothetical protein
MPSHQQTQVVETYPLDNPHHFSAINMNSPEDGESVRDPIEAIYALNIGDFMADSFISDDLLRKISHRLSDDPDKLKAQLEELIQIYSMDKTLGVLGLDAQAGFLIYDSIAATLAGMFQDPRNRGKLSQPDRHLSGFRKRTALGS